MIFTGEAIAVVLGGNIAYGFNQAGISWRAAPLGLAVASAVLSAAMALTVREPPKGRFIVQAVRAHCSRCAPAACAHGPPWSVCACSAYPPQGQMRSSCEARA